MSYDLVRGARGQIKITREQIITSLPPAVTLELRSDLFPNSHDVSHGLQG